MKPDSNRESPVIDYETYDAIKEMLEDEFDEVIEEFYEYASDAMIQLKDSADNSCLEKLCELSHPFASSCAHLGFSQLANSLRHLEHQSRTGADFDYRGSVLEISEYYDTLIQQLKQ